MKFADNSPIIEDTDASLVEKSLGGDQLAFEQIVNRYQRLLCSLAYSSLGSLNESEDVAQEAFVEAWKKLENLREPEKLKSWLCSILRFKISHHRRKDSRQPVSQANDLSMSEELESKDPSIEESTMKEEEQALLWQALEAVPETYRETLILYYREHRSVEHVASELDLSEDAVKQRLSRGRKVLQEKMMNFVEGALVRTAPKKAFTAGVIAAIASATPSAKAAGVGTAAGATAAKAGWASLAPILMSVSGVLSPIFALRANLAQSKTKSEKQASIRNVIVFAGSTVLFMLAMYGLRLLSNGIEGHAVKLAIFSQVGVLVCIVTYVTMTFKMLKRMRSLRTNEKARRPDLFNTTDDNTKSKKREYISRATLFGFPLIHAKFDMAEEGEPAAVGWIAAGQKAYGLLFAWGGVAVAPISVGIISFGLVSAGVIGFGALVIGIIGVGCLAMGEAAIGYKAYASSSALGWESAYSKGVSIANEGALAPVAFAQQVNNELAASTASLANMSHTYPWIFALTAVLVLVPVVWWSNSVRKRMK